MGAHKKDWRLVLVMAGATFLAFAMGLLPCLGSHAKASEARTRNLAAWVPFVGCRADGQIGPIEAPKGKARMVPIVQSLASRLAYYKAEEGLGFGVLAPRGWYCFCVYGSNGATLYVSPDPIDTANLFSPNWKGPQGSAIEINDETGSTSGRYRVAKVIARVFPAHRAFARKVLAEGLDPSSEFPFVPYPEDKLHYKSPEIVEYQTPARRNGLGTVSGLQKNADPISGVAILLGQTPDLLLLSVRLPHNLNELTPVIVQQVEREGG